MNELSAQNISKRMFLLGVFICFFISGCSALIYQIVWTRKCILLLGSTSYAISTVLSIFFLGLGIGSVIGGRISDLSRNPLRWYGTVELVIGIWVLIVIEWFSGGGDFIVDMFGYIPENATALFFFRLGVSVFWFLLPAIGMGMTFPLLSKYENKGGIRRLVHIPILYLVNTSGATMGTLLSGFFLIPRFGYGTTTIIGVAINLFAGMLGFFLSFMQTARVYFSSMNEERNLLEGLGKYSKNREVRVFVLFLGVFITGLTCLGLEVLWSRLLLMVFLGTNYAYTTVLATVLVGIAIGSLCIALLSNRLRFRLGTLGLWYGLTGIGVVLTLALIARLPYLMEKYHIETSDSLEYVILGKFILSFLVLFFPMMGFGISFPYALNVIRESEQKFPYFSIGLAYGINTIGGILGSIFGGFFILPYLGCELGTLILGMILIGMGALLLTMDGEKRIRNFCVLLICFVLLFYFKPEKVIESINRFYIPKGHKILYFAEGVEGTVAVSSPEQRTGEDERVLWINRVQATTAVERGIKMNRFQGIIPWMFDREPKKVLFMCFGSGITCGTLGIGGFDEIDAVEISEEVLKASEEFADKNFNVLEMENIHLFLDDARNFLFRSKKKYDFITMEPMPLALAGVSLFYTYEFFHACLSRLTDGGMVSQWVPFHSTHPKIVHSVIKTFIEVFPYTLGLFVNADLFLIGSNQELLLSPCNLEETLKRNSKLQEAMAEAGFIDVNEILACFVVDRAGLECLSQHGIPITDSFPWVEFEAPRFIYNRDSVPENIHKLKVCLTPIEKMLEMDSCPIERESIVRRHLSHLKDLDGLIQYYRGFFVADDARRLFIDSLKIDKKNSQARYYLRTIAIDQIKQFQRWGEEDKWKAIIEEVSPYLLEDAVWNEFLGTISFYDSSSSSSS